MPLEETAMDQFAEGALAKVATDTLDPLVLDFVEWVAGEQRSYADVLDAWKTSCPRLTVWEDASERGFIMRINVPGHGVFIGVTSAGRAFLRRHGRPLHLSQQRDDFPGRLAE
jgi:hypothetical protein